MSQRRVTFTLILIRLILHLSSISQYHPLQSLWRELIAAITAQRVAVGSRLYWKQRLHSCNVALSHCYQQILGYIIQFEAWQKKKPLAQHHNPSSSPKRFYAFLAWFILPYPSCHVPLVPILHCRCVSYSHLAVLSIQSRSPSRTFVRD